MLRMTQVPQEDNIFVISGQFIVKLCSEAMKISVFGMNLQ